MLDTTPQTRPPRYHCKRLRSLAHLYQLFPADVDFQETWLFLATGVQGESSTLDDIEGLLADSEALALDPDAHDHSIGALVVQSRLGRVYLGHITVGSEDIPLLRLLVARTVQGIAFSQEGNYPKGGLHV